MSALAPALALSNDRSFIIMEKAEGLVVADPVVCVGCGRCELACTEFNSGKTAPALSRRAWHRINAGIVTILILTGFYLRQHGIAAIKPIFHRHGIRWKTHARCQGRRSRGAKHDDWIAS